MGRRTCGGCVWSTTRKKLSPCVHWLRWGLSKVQPRVSRVAPAPHVHNRTSTPERPTCYMFFLLHRVQGGWMSCWRRIVYIHHWFTLSREPSGQEVIGMGPILYCSSTDLQLERQLCDRSLGVAQPQRVPHKLENGELLKALSSHRSKCCIEGRFQFPFFPSRKSARAREFCLVSTQPPPPEFTRPWILYRSASTQTVTRDPGLLPSKFPPCAECARAWHQTSVHETSTLRVIIFVGAALFLCREVVGRGVVGRNCQLPRSRWS